MKAWLSGVVEHSIAGAALVVSLIALYFSSCSGAHLTTAVGQEVFLNAKPRVGVLTNIYNSGARPGSVIRGTLTWDSIELRLVMTSPQINSWSYAGGKMIEQQPTTFIPFVPLLVGGNASQAATLWFTRDEAPTDRLFTAGLHRIEMRLFDGIANDPVASSRFVCQLMSGDIQGIYAKGAETSEFAVGVTPSQ